MSSMIPTSASTPSILNFFKRKSETPDRIPDKRIRCPACHILVGKAALNSHLDSDCKSRSNGDNQTSKKDDANGAFSSSDESDFADAASSLVEAVYSASSQSSAEGDRRRGSEPPATPKRYDFESCAPRRFDE